VFNRTPKEESHELDQAITDLIAEFAGAEAGSEEEVALANAVKTLMEARIADKMFAKKPTVSPDALIGAGASILGIICILGFEKANVITTKSFSLIPKIKI
jgi:hypothetical protein